MASAPPTFYSKAAPPQSTLEPSLSTVIFSTPLSQSAKLFTPRQSAQLIIYPPLLILSPFRLLSFSLCRPPYTGPLSGRGFAFSFLPQNQQLGPFNFANDNSTSSNHVFGVEFDLYEDEEFGDINDNHVGIDVNSLISGFDGPLMSVALDLSGVFEDEMYVGFIADYGGLLGRSNNILAWSFSNTNSSLSEGLITRGLPSFVLPKIPKRSRKTLIAGIAVGVLSIVIIMCSVIAFLLIRRNRRKREEIMGDWELEYWPHRLTYQEIDSATKNFSEENVIGIGGNGKVYKGVLSGGSEVAVKRISNESGEGIRAFLAEISSLGRLQHRNLVGLRGWCKKKKGSLILVYNYMENGSLDKRVFECKESKMLNWEERIRVLKQVASAVLYLHEGWESKVLHRDIKSSNVLINKEMNARLGDFGLARMHDHGKEAGATSVVGTVGYLAPEIVRSGRASTQTDVFGYGVLVLEVICGRRPIEENKPPLLEWVWELLRKGELINTIDARLRSRGELDLDEVERVLTLGLLCAHPDPSARPNMKQVVKLFEGENEVEESKGEGMDVYLLEKMKVVEILALYPQIFNKGSGFGSHQKLEDTRKKLSYSMSMSSSIFVGR